VAIDHYRTEEGRWQLVAIGELPVATLNRIVRSIKVDLPQAQANGPRSPMEGSDKNAQP